MARKDKNTAEATTDNDWIRLTSDDGYTFLVRRTVANASGTLNDTIDTEGNFAEAASKHVNLQQRGVIVERMLDYMSFKAHYENSTEDVPVHEMLDRINPEVVLELLLSADYSNM
ncbi:hypothetical protein MKEN_01126500 [Mycena kentingensis (nom. inval.)]|nr:hypothetical protein MKEN_01126500 [Mycena kentingensis (nom. inval.)]